MLGFSILFYVFSAFAILFGIGVIAAKNPIHSALSLVMTLFSLAGIYVLLHAEFLAIIQVLTYAGAILVVFIFIIMLLNLKPDEMEEKGYSLPAKLFLGIFGLALFFGLGFILKNPRMAEQEAAAGAPDDVVVPMRRVVLLVAGMQ